MKADLQAGTEQLRTEMSSGFAEMRAYVDFSFKAVRDELRMHFDLTAESFRSEFRNLYDWTLATTTSLATRVEALERRDAPSRNRPTSRDPYGPRRVPAERAMPV